MILCEQCGKEHEGTFGSGRFCSRSCSNKWVALHQSDEAKSKKIAKGKQNLRPHPEKLLGYGGWTEEKRKEQSIRMSRVMQNPETRRKISLAGRGRVLSEESRRKISIKVKKSFEDGRNKGWVTRRAQESYAEQFWRSVLDNNGISYQQEYTVHKSSLGVKEPGCYFLDFLLPGRVDLEIDGHQHYEQSRKEHDKVRDERLTNSGYTVYRIKYVSPRNSLVVKEDINSFLNWYRDFMSKS